MVGQEKYTVLITWPHLIKQASAVRSVTLFFFFFMWEEKKKPKI